MSEDSVKDALNLIPYGFYAVTTSDGGDDLNIMVANWFSQVSFSPRLVALGLAKNSYSHKLIQKGGVFAVNIFQKEDERYIKYFTKSRERNPDKVANANYTLSPTIGCPVVEGAAAVLEVRVKEVLDVGGDHDVIMGEAVGAQILKEGECSDTLTLPDIGWSYAG